MLTKKNNLLSEWGAIISIMRFLSCKICFNNILYQKKRFLGWDDIVENEPGSISKEHIFGDPFITKNMHHFFSSIVDIHGNANAGYAHCCGRELPYKT